LLELLASARQHSNARKINRRHIYQRCMMMRDDDNDATIRKKARTCQRQAKVTLTEMTI
jgi:hypothetical protein